MPTSAENKFSYSGTLPAGGEISGTLMAADQATAVAILEKMGVGAGQVRPTRLDRESRQMASSDASAGPIFHQRLLRLVQSGLPTEFALRLLRVHTRGSPVAKGVANVSRDLDSGIKAVEAVARHRNEFPAEYIPLLDAGVRSNNLGAVLIQLQAHLDLAQELGNSLRRVLYYVVSVLAVLLALLGVAGFYLVPIQTTVIRFLYAQTHRHFFSAFGYHAPAWPRAWFWLARTVPEFAFIAGTVVLSAILIWTALRVCRLAGYPRDWLAYGVPTVGPALRSVMVACWSSALRAGVTGGMDLPQAVEFAGALSQSPRVRDDSAAIVGVLHQAMPLAHASPGRIIPKATTLMIQRAVGAATPINACAGLVESFQREAQSRIAEVFAVVASLCFFVAAVVIFAAILDVLLPLLNFVYFWMVW